MNSEINKLIIPKFCNQQFDYSGQDNLKGCLDRKLFLQWPHKVNYNYNSRGFRDQEWPQDLNSAVWCFGDSFTVGIGSCFEHTWPQVLSQHSQRRVINVSMDGASNEWIARQVCDAYDLVGPRNMIIMWSYLHRRENADNDQSDLDRRLHSVRSTVEQDFENLRACRKQVHEHCVRHSAHHEHCVRSNLIELIIPNFVNEIDQTGDFSADLITVEYQDGYHCDFSTDLITVEYLDRARDGHHFDIVTAEWVAKQVQNLLTL